VSVSIYEFPRLDDHVEVSTTQGAAKKLGSF